MRKQIEQLLHFTRARGALWTTRIGYSVLHIPPRCPHRTAWHMWCTVLHASACLCTITSISASIYLWQNPVWSMAVFLTFSDCLHLLIITMVASDNEELTSKTTIVKTSQTVNTEISQTTDIGNQTNVLRFGNQSKQLTWKPVTQSAQNQSTKHSTT